MYKTESTFSRRVIKALGTKFPMVLRIESGETGRGFPDIYCVGPKGEQWYELKNCLRLSIKDIEWTIPWRTGQQAWHLKYRQACKKTVYTLVAMSDGYLIIPMDKRYINNKVKHFDCIRCKDFNDMIYIC